MGVDIYQLPIPDWGLHCPTCRYPLKGLPSHRCPECGRGLKMDEIVQPWVRLRDPRRVEDERPLPDMGLSCRKCGYLLAGLTEPRCPECGWGIDFSLYFPKGERFMLTEYLAGRIPLFTVPGLLAEHQIPFIVVTTKQFRDHYFGQRTMAPPIWVPSDFYLEACALLRGLQREMEVAGQDAKDWRCGACGEEIPAHFEVCWNCGTGRHGRAD